MLSTALMSQSMPLTLAATQAEMQQTDDLQASTIVSQMQSNQDLTAMHQWQNQQETATKTFQMLQETTTQRVKTGDKIYEKWLSVIRE
ncbi:MAG TPA: hypothetical protein VGO93_17395 [Candidatus Xenobia bacterium]|jgi:hypothetical protein